MKTVDSYRKQLTRRPMKGTWIVKLERLKKCKKCYKLVENNTEFEKHKQEHDNESKSAHSKEKYLCDYCKKEISHLELLRDHIESLHMKAFYYEDHEKSVTVKIENDNDTSGYHNCNHCSKTFVKYESFKSHLKKCKVQQIVEENESNSKVKYSEAKTKTKYECDKCDKTYKSGASLLDHQKSFHEGIKYNCEKCNLHYATKQSLRRHIQATHDGFRLECNKCHKLIQKANLLRHMKIVHEGVRYNCSHCDKKYAEKAMLNQHIRSTHKGKMFTCKSLGCEKVFGLLRSMRSHFDKVHKN